MPRTHTLMIAALIALCLLAGCGGVPSAPSVFSAPQPPIARAFTSTPTLAPNPEPARAPQSQAATPVAIAVQAAPVSAPIAIATPAQLDPLGQSIDTYLNEIVNAGWFQ